MVMVEFGRERIRATALEVVVLQWIIYGALIGAAQKSRKAVTIILAVVHIAAFVVAMIVTRNFS